MVDPVVDEAGDAHALNDRGFVTLVPGPRVQESEVDPFDGGWVWLSASGKVAAVQVCLMPRLLYQRDGGVDDGETFVGDNPAGVFQDIQQELTGRDIEGRNVGGVPVGGPGGGDGVCEDVAVFDICAVCEGLAFVSV